jgi:hypothetical protein
MEVVAAQLPIPAACPQTNPVSRSVKKMSLIAPLYGVEALHCACDVSAQNNAHSVKTNLFKAVIFFKDTE